MQNPTLATEAIRTFFTLQCCWLNSEEIYLEKGCTHCGAAATYLIYYTNSHIQKMMLEFIEKYNCHLSKGWDLLDLHDFEEQYNDFLQLLEKEVNFYARQHHDIARPFAFEALDSIFERPFALAC